MNDDENSNVNGSNERGMMIEGNEEMTAPVHFHLTSIDPQKVSKHANRSSPSSNNSSTKDCERLSHDMDTQIIRTDSFAQEESTREIKGDQARLNTMRTAPERRRIEKTGDLLKRRNLLETEFGLNKKQANSIIEKQRKLKRDTILNKRRKLTFQSSEGSQNISCNSYGMAGEVSSNKEGRSLFNNINDEPDPVQMYGLADIGPQELERVNNYEKRQDSYRHNSMQLMNICKVFGLNDANCDEDSLEKCFDLLGKYLADKDISVEAQNNRAFQVVEAGVVPYLVDILQNTQNQKLKRKAMRIIVNICCGSDRESIKLMQQGLHRAILKQIENQPDMEILQDAIWALNNLNISGRKIRDRILSERHQIFRQLHDICIKFSNDKAIHGEVAFFIHSSLEFGCFDEDFHLHSILEALYLCTHLLKIFNFEDQHNISEGVLNKESNKYLLDIVRSMRNICLIQFRHINMEKKVDSLINQTPLFLPLMQILQLSQFNPLLSETWHLIGMMCCCSHSKDNVLQFVQVSNINLIQLCHQQLTKQNQVMCYPVLKFCIFTLSNIATDRSDYVKVIVETNLIAILENIWRFIIERQKELGTALEDRASEEFHYLSEIKNEIIYCVANCVAGVFDCLLLTSLQHLSKAIQQGALKILVEAIDFHSSFTDSLGLKVALEGIYKYFQQFSMAKKADGQETREFGVLFDQLLDEFEFQFNGLDMLEKCQFHYDHKVYKMSVKILTKFFEAESEMNSELVKFLLQIEEDQKTQVDQHDGPPEYDITNNDNSGAERNNDINCPE